MTSWEARWQAWATDEELVELQERGRAAIAAVHRRPVSLRKADITSAEGVLRGAVASGRLDEHLADQLSQEQITSCYSVVAPQVVANTSRTVLRAPAQVLARLDVLAGGPGRPAGQTPPPLGLLRGGGGDMLAPLAVHYELLRGQVFGPRSGVIGRVFQRAMWVASGVDPAGLTVPEVYLVRHQQRYRETVAQEDARGFVIEGLKALIAGAEEAEGIARAAG